MWAVHSAVHTSDTDVITRFLTNTLKAGNTQIQASSNLRVEALATMTEDQGLPKYDAVVLVTSHQSFRGKRYENRPLFPYTLQQHCRHRGNAGQYSQITRCHNPEESNLHFVISIKYLKIITYVYNRNVPGSNPGNFYIEKASGYHIAEGHYSSSGGRG